MYDVANKESFENVARWSQEVDRYLDIGVKVVVGNKSDLAAAVTPGDPQVNTFHSLICFYFIFFLFSFVFYFLPFFRCCRKFAIRLGLLIM